MVQEISQGNGRLLSWKGAADGVNAARAQVIALIVNPSESASAFAGETFELRVAMTNQGNQGAIINVYIDETSGVLRQWCTSPYDSLALGNNCSAEVIFRFAIPINANPDIYNYLLVIDAPKHYPEDTPIRHEGQLQVLPPVQSALRVSDPTFTIVPTTTASQPATIQPGEPLDLKMVVHNRSDRVDRFRLTCPDLPPDWLTAIYPEGLVELGFVEERESLALNPGAKAEIQLRLLFPLNITAGNYSPTVCLTSVNYQDLGLTEVVYLQVVPTYRLTPELQTMIGKVGEETGWFRLLLLNSGNTLRDIAVIVRENAGKPICTYSFTPERVRLGTPVSTQIDLRVKPNKWWRRPWFGSGLPIQFYVELEDAYQLPVPDRLEGTLIWEPRPLWHLILLILAGMGAIASLIFLLWWVFFRQPATPKIAEFVSTAPAYQESAGDAIYLNWQIRDPQQLKAIKIVGISADNGIVAHPATSYDFSQGIPRELKDFCTLEKILTCQNIRTEIQQAGNYVFQMEISAKRGEQVADSQKTNTIRVELLPLPKIVELNSTQPVYQEAVSNLAPNSKIALNWKISNPERLQALKLIGRTANSTVISPLKVYNFRSGIPNELSQFCSLQPSVLICRQVPTNAGQAGDYVFELFAVPQLEGSEVIISKKTENILIKPYLWPLKIESLSVNGQEALPKYILSLSPQRLVRTLQLSWKVVGDKSTQVELLPAPGTVGLEGSISYPITQQPGVERIILSVTGGAGQKLSRTIAIEKISPPLSDRPLNFEPKSIRPSPLLPIAPTVKPTPLKMPNNTVATPLQPPLLTFPIPSITPPNPSPSPNSQVNIPAPPPLISPIPLEGNLSSPTPSSTPASIPSPHPSPLEMSPQFD